MATAGPSALPWGQRRQVARALRRLEQLRELSSEERLALRPSPPYLPSLVAQSAALLAAVCEPQRLALRVDEGRYLAVHVGGVLDKTEQALQLFRQGRELMYQEDSSYRRSLTKLSLLFSHMLWELQAVFPGGRFHGDTYRITQMEAAEFWKRCFGNRCIVDWKSFKQQLQMVHAFEEGMECLALKSTVDLTCNDHVSVFEFDIFTRLFQPWKSLIKNWNHLAVTHPGYMAFLTYDQVKARLEQYLHKPGSYIFRLSCTRMGQWAIGHVTVGGAIVQTIPENTPLCQALLQGAREGCYLYPDGRHLNPDLTSLSELTQSKVTVNEEQHQLYSEMGSSFQQCKICTERDKDTRILPCGHLLCKTCLLDWQKSDGHTCPFCRCDIRGTEPVVITPYLGRHGQEDYEDDDDDHEDIELVLKEMAAMKQQASSQDYNVPQPDAPPPLPPKHSMAYHRLPPPCSPRDSALLARPAHCTPGISHTSSDDAASVDRSHRADE